jgi:hypothetical protein
MSAPDVLLHTIGRSLLDTLDVSVLSDVMIEATAEFAETIWRAWDARADYGQKCRELEALARTGTDELEGVVDGVVGRLGLSPRDVQTESVHTYLRLLPGVIRRHFRRPARPLGTDLPAGLPLYGSWDLLPLLPARMPRFQPEDRPWSVGDWELRELIEMTPDAEVWKAVNPRLADRPPAALHFFTSSAAKRYLRGDAAALLDRVLVLGRLPGLVPVQQLHLFADPPCVQYPFLLAPDLASLLQEWRETGTAADPLEIGDLVLQIAETLGRLHGLGSPVVLRSLRATSILLMTDATGHRRCLLAKVGLGPLADFAHAGSDGDPYASPEQRRGAPARPPDDVYALGVLWFQLLEGNLTRGRPGGSSWRRRLVAGGMPVPLVELLETCFDDDPTARPADGSALAAQIRAIGRGAR